MWWKSLKTCSNTSKNKIIEYTLLADPHGPVDHWLRNCGTLFTMGAQNDWFICWFCFVCRSCFMLNETGRQKINPELVELYHCKKTWLYVRRSWKFVVLSSRTLVAACAKLSPHTSLKMTGVSAVRSGFIFRAIKGSTHLWSFGVLLRDYMAPQDFDLRARHCDNLLSSYEQSEFEIRQSWPISVYYPCICLRSEERDYKLLT